jgi:hypothetical protein
MTIQKAITISTTNSAAAATKITKALKKQHLKQQQQKH